MTIFSNFYEVFFSLFSVDSLFSLFAVIGIIALCLLILSTLTTNLKTKKQIKILYLVRSITPIFSILLLQSYLLSINTQHGWLKEANLQLILLFYFLFMIRERMQVYIIWCLAIVLYVFLNLFTFKSDTNFSGVIFSSVGLIALMITSSLVHRYSFYIIDNKSFFIFAMIAFASGWWLILLPPKYRSITLFIALVCKFIIYMTIIHMFNHLGRRQWAKYETIIDRINVDALTDVRSRAAFETDFAEAFELSKRGDIMCSFIIFDVDDFKIVNDTYGHMIGDIVLKSVANIILSELKSNDNITVYRIGGEEFGVILKHATILETQSTAILLMQSVSAAQIKTTSGTLHVTISVGATNFQKDDTTKENFYNRADQYLYLSKSNNKSQVTVNGFTFDEQSIIERFEE